MTCNVKMTCDADVVSLELTSAVAGGDGGCQHLTAAMDAVSMQLWQRWTIETAFNCGGGNGVRWQKLRLTAFDGIGNMDYDKAMMR